MSDTLPALMFDEYVPPMRSLRDHYGDENWGLGAKLLDLADRCPGFRVLVLSAHIISIMESCVKDTKLKRVSAPTLELRHTHGWPKLVGTWRGHEVYFDAALEEKSGYLAAKVGGEKLGLVTLYLSEPQRWEKP